MTKKTSKLPPQYQIWANAKKQFSLSDMPIQMARELGLNPSEEVEKE